MKTADKDFELEIFEMIGHGGSQSLTMRYPDKNIISISWTSIVVHDKVANTLGVKKGDRILFASNGKSLFISIPPFDCTLKGYKLSAYKKLLSFRATKYLETHDIKVGHYHLIETPVFYKGIDWYELELLTKEN